MNRFGKFFGWIIFGVVILVFAVLFGLCDLVGGEDNDHEDGLGKIVLVSHGYDCYDEYSCDGYYEGDRNYDQDQDYGSYDRNRNRNRNRGAFSPGPFDRSPVEMHDVCISLNCSGRADDKQSGEEGQEMQQVALKSASAEPQSLVPPTPGAIRDFVIQVTKAGLEMGQLFANTVIAFVSNLFIGLA